MKQYLMPSYGEIMKHALTCKAIGAEVCSSVWCEFVLVKVNMNQLGVILYLNMYVCKFEPIQHVFRQKAFCKESILFHSYTLFYSLQRGQGIFIAINYTHVFSGDPRFSYNYDYTLVEGRRTNSYTFTDLPKAWGDQFAFRMSAYAVVGDNLYQSQWTELTEVPIPSNIDNTHRENQEIKVISYPGNTIIRLLVPQEIIISDLQGRIVAQVQGVEGDNSISLKQGIYLLRCGNHCQKFICR